MSLLRLAVLGPPEVFHDTTRLTFPLRKAQALLLYLAVEGGMHSRSKLAAFLWPDSQPQAGRIALRNALVPLRSLLDAPQIAASQPRHLHSSRDQLGLNPQAPLEMDLDVVQQAYQQVQRATPSASEERHAVLLAEVQHALALVRGPFLDGFWLGEDSPFDEWREQQQRQWQVRLLLLLDRLSSWYEAAGAFEAARETLTRWLALDPLAEETSRRLMRVSLALGDPGAAMQVYTMLQARLADEFQMTPTPETVALAEQSRALTRRGGYAAMFPTRARSVPPANLVAPFLGRTGAFRQLVKCFQQARQGRPQIVLVVGEAGIGKTRLAHEFVTWARAQGAEVVRGHAFEMGGRLPYQPLVQALRERLEAENAPEDLLEDVWLAELARLLPELRVRYPDLPAPTEDELAAKVRLFESCVRLLDALARRAPLMLFLDDLQWTDEASLDLLRYLGHAWKEQGSRVLVLGTLREEEVALQPELAAQLGNLERELPVTRVPLQPLTRKETFQLVEALVGERAPSHGQESQRAVLADFLFTHTGGQPLYLGETLKLLRERELLVPYLGTDGAWRLEPIGNIVEAIAQEGSRLDLFPPSVRALVQARLARLTAPARHLVMASAVLGTQATARHLWQIAEVESPSPGPGAHAGIEALEEAMKRGLLREEAGRGHLSSYSFAHDLIRDIVYTELGEARRQNLHQRASMVLRSEGANAAELAYHARLAGETETAYRFSVQAGMEAVAVFAVADAIGYYEQARALLQESPQFQDAVSISEVERLYVHLGQAYAFQEAYSRVQQIYEELLMYARHKQQFSLVSMALNRLAILAIQQANDQPTARALLEQALQIVETHHDQRMLAETKWNLAQIMTAAWQDPISALPHGQQAFSLARAIHNQELEARSLLLLGWIALRTEELEQATRYFEKSLQLYAHLRPEQKATQGLSLAHFMSGAPLNQSLTYRASEIMCWAFLGLVQIHSGQQAESIHSGRKALELAQATRNVWVCFTSTYSLVHALLDAGSYEEAHGLMQNLVAPARTLPPGIVYQRFLIALERTYHALQQWEEARSILVEADTVAERLNLGRVRAPALSQLCMNYAVTGAWEKSGACARIAVTERRKDERGLLMLDFSPYDIEALLRAGEERLAREELQRLGEHLVLPRRFRVSYLQSWAILAAWENKHGQAIGLLREAATLAAEINLPGEQWQIQAALGKLYEAKGAHEHASMAYTEATNLIQELARDIQDDEVRARFLCGPQIHPVLQRAQDLAAYIHSEDA
ncbi:ATP-binding protein [Dictyobacter formicarum]|uniref:Bacterial transcriptional activator domain-containing protein n=1 Tax=Dictyobacter formicarum TaxID=2778368 RepID=A0ABQ3V9Z8_9CHLR|nr:AAA family ATPase [Dictyobacter formicarum]GHO82669.1 hypothetical protein KSZ_06750 [Dictyobacter formicarum]